MACVGRQGARLRVQPLGQHQVVAFSVMVGETCEQSNARSCCATRSWRHRFGPIHCKGRRAAGMQALEAHTPLSSGTALPAVVSHWGNCFVGGMAACPTSRSARGIACAVYLPMRCLFIHTRVLPATHRPAPPLAPPAPPYWWAPAARCLSCLPAANGPGSGAVLM